MDADGLSKVFDAAETASSAIEEARPLLENAVRLVDEVNCLAPVPTALAEKFLARKQTFFFVSILQAQ